MMATRLVAKQSFLRYVSNQTRFCPTIVISKAECPGIGVYETNQSIRESYWNDNRAFINNFEPPQFDIATSKFEGATFTSQRHGSKYCIVAYLRSLSLHKQRRQIVKCQPGSLEEIINSAHLRKWILLRLKEEPAIAPPKWDECSLIVCLKPITNNGADGAKKTGVKLDMELNIAKQIWQQLTLTERLQLFAWTKQLGDYVKKFKWTNFSGTSTTFYYEPIAYSQCQSQSIQIKAHNIKLGQLTAPINGIFDCIKIVPGFEYNPKIKPIPTLDTFLARQNVAPICRFLPLGHELYLKVGNKSIGDKVLLEYLSWVKEDTSGHHEYSSNKHGIWRRKSYTHKNYWYPSAEYKSLLKECKKSKLKYAHKNLAGGLRIIPNDTKPDWLLNLWPLLPALPEPKEVDQVGYVLYQYSGDEEVSFGGIWSHDEWEMFAKSRQYCVGKDGMLTIDGGGGDVNATIGIPLPQNSMFVHNMFNYFQSGSRLVGRGGKHSLSRRHCILRKGEYRFTIIFRTCTTKANRAAWRHWKVCKNQDHHCYCLNPKLKLLNKMKKGGKKCKIKSDTLKKRKIS